MLRQATKKSKRGRGGHGKRNFIDLINRHFGFNSKVCKIALNISYRAIKQFYTSVRSSQMTNDKFVIVLVVNFNMVRFCAVGW